jgi:hypothetical protein
MARKTSLTMLCVLSVGLLLGAASILLGAQSAAAAKYKRPGPVVHRLHHTYATSRGHQFEHPATLPYGPEYGFLAHVPPNAIRCRVIRSYRVSEFVRPTDECVRQPLPGRQVRF